MLCVFGERKTTAPGRVARVDLQVQVSATATASFFRGWDSNLIGSPSTSHLGLLNVRPSVNGGLLHGAPALFKRLSSDVSPMEGLFS